MFGMLKRRNPHMVTQHSLTNFFVILCCLIDKFCTFLCKLTFCEITFSYFLFDWVFSLLVTFEDAFASFILAEVH